MNTIWTIQSTLFLKSSLNILAYKYFEVRFKTNIQTTNKNFHLQAHAYAQI